MGRKIRVISKYRDGMDANVIKEGDTVVMKSRTKMKESVHPYTFERYKVISRKKMKVVRAMSTRIKLEGFHDYVHTDLVDAVVLGE